MNQGRAKESIESGEDFDEDDPRESTGVHAIVGDRSVDAGEMRLTRQERALLDYLRQRADRVVSRGELLVDLWGYRVATLATRTVDVHVQKVRAKLKLLWGDGPWIATVRGVGYRWIGRTER